jgi:hypothetical protein
MLKQLIVQQTSLQEGDFGIRKEKIEEWWWLWNYEVGCLSEASNYICLLML